MGYVGKVRIGDSEHLIGSTLYGICATPANTSAKNVTSTTISNTTITSTDYINTVFNNPINGTTIHVKFINGNSVDSGVTLLVGTTGVINVVGNCICPAGTVISFTLDWTTDQDQIVYSWVVNNVNTYTFTEGSTNGAFSVIQDGATTAQSISIHGLNNAAYRDVVTNLAGSTTSSGLPTALTVADYVSLAISGGLSNLTGPMHLIGTTSVTITDGGYEDPEIENYDFGTDGEHAVNGDVVISGLKEFVWIGDAWELLGDEGSYAFDNAVLHNTLLNSAGAIIYGVTSGSQTIPATLAGNSSDTKKFLSMTSSTPSWVTLTSADVGLSHVSDHAQVTSLQWDTTDKSITYKISEGTATELLTFSAGNNVTLTTSGTTLTINAINTKVTQAYGSTSANYPLLLSSTSGLSGTETRDDTAIINNAIYANPSTGTIHATTLEGSLHWSYITSAHIADSNLGVVKTTSTVSTFTDYTPSPIDANGVIYYQKYKSAGTADAITALALTYTTSSTVTENIATLSSSATALGYVESGILYIKSMYYGTTTVSTGVIVDATST